LNGPRKIRHWGKSAGK